MVAFIVKKGYSSKLHLINIFFSKKTSLFGAFVPYECINCVWKAYSKDFYVKTFFVPPELFLNDVVTGLFDESWSICETKWHLSRNWWEPTIIEIKSRQKLSEYWKSTVVVLKNPKSFKHKKICNRALHKKSRKEGVEFSHISIFFGSITILYTVKLNLVHAICFG